MNRRHFIGTAAAALAARTAFAKPAFAKPAFAKPAADSLKAAAASRGLLFGCAVDTSLIGRDEPYTRLVQQQAGIVVAENAMKMGPMRPAVDRFDFVGGDRLVALAQANRMKVRGHNFCWHRQLPTWFEGYATKQNARGLLTDHIRTVGTHYAGKIHSWDVVNEAVFPPDGRPDGLRESPWLKLIGPDYIELAFRTARDIDPKALLTYNDYGIEEEDDASSEKRAAVLSLLRSLKGKGLVDALGIQSHIRVGGRYGAGLTDFIKTAAGMGLEIYLTEMDVNDRALPPDIPSRDLAVAKLYGDYLDLVLRDTAVKAVLTWGITDAHTWLNGEDAREDHFPERALPFGAGFEPLQAYFSTKNALSTTLRR